MSGHKQFDMNEMARLLKMRKMNNHHTVLLLGARAGGLFRSEHFYDSLQQFSNRDFNELSLSERFGECYSILTKNLFSETDIHSILRTSLQKLTVAESDAYLVELVKQGYFDEIISTNIDGMLEDAFKQAEMKEEHEFEVFIAGRDAPQYEKSLLFRITKAFGDFSSRVYTIRGRLSHLDSNQELKGFIQHLLAKDLLVVGIDPVWDEGILRAIPEKAGIMWFVSEEDLNQRSLISSLLGVRQNKCIVGREGKYENFVGMLHGSLCGSFVPGFVPINYKLASDILGRLQVLWNEHQIILSEIRKLQNEIGNSS